MSASIGVAGTGEDGLTAADLLRLADAALYQAKGRGRSSIFDASLRKRLDGRLDDEAELREGLANDEFTGWFQPIVDLMSGRIDAAEGLARWERPDGVRNAGDSIELATEIGLDFALSTIVLADVRRLQCELQAIVAAIAGIGRNLGYQIVAEGIENIEQANVLRDLGVTHGQGYLFSRAVPADEFLRFANVTSTSPTCSDSCPSSSRPRTHQCRDGRPHEVDGVVGVAALRGRLGRGVARRSSSGSSPRSARCCVLGCPHAVRRRHCRSVRSEPAGCRARTGP